MKTNWRFCLPLLATLALAACGTTDGGGARGDKDLSAPTGPAGDAQSLTAYHWKLQQAYTGAGHEDQSWFLTAGSGKPNLQLDFAEQRLSVKNLCNLVSAPYRTTGDRLEVQRAMSTLRACDDQALMKLEQQVTRQLPKAQRWAVQLGTGQQAPRLTVTFIDGVSWQLQGTPTAQTQYGSAGETMFYEIAPQRVSCNHALIKNYQCLQVRELRYGDNGVKTYTGPWQNFYSEIDGYQHRGGVHNVVRVKRYQRKDVPSDAPSYVYKLDLVVESENVRAK